MLQNLSFTLRAFGGLSCCRMRALGGGFLLATGTKAASENWVYLNDPRYLREALETVGPFFEAQDLPFIWPLFPDTATAGRELLNAAGLPCRGQLLAMSCALPAPAGPDGKVGFSQVREADAAREWAETAWRAFDAPPGAPAPFAALAEGLAGRDDFHLATAFLNGAPAGTFLLSFAPLAPVGLYYFAVLPALRREGVGRAMIREIFRVCCGRGAVSLSLQATPAGVPFYSAVGFKPLFEIPVHSRSEEIF